MEAFDTIAPLILASNSPRRKAFLTDLALKFVVQAADIDETPLCGEIPEHFVKRLAREKAQSVAAAHQSAWILAADTIVTLNKRILGKPRDEEEAVEMLMALSGTWHEVWTGFCLYQKDRGQLYERAVRTRVHFIKLSPTLCRAYVGTGEPLDKAGAYGIQGKGCFLVAEIEGSYTNVVGLPMSELIEALLACNIIAPASSL